MKFLVVAMVLAQVAGELPVTVADEPAAGWLAIADLPKHRSPKPKTPVLVAGDIRSFRYGTEMSFLFRRETAEDANHCDVAISGPASVCEFADDTYPIPNRIDAGHPVFTINGDHDVAKCLPALRDAVKAARVAWHPRPLPKTPLVQSMQGFLVVGESLFAKLCSYADMPPDNCCIKKTEPERLRCHADAIETKEKREAEQEKRAAEAVAALNAVDEACGEMK